MAQKTVVRVYDDIDGTELNGDAKHVSFALNGTTYELDLGPQNAAKLEDALGPFIEVARRVSGRSSGRTASKSSSGGSTTIDNKAVRAWAESNGIEISSRGRISAEVVEKYKAAGN